MAVAVADAECKMCYEYQQAAGATCSMKPDTSACWSSAIRGYCSLFNALVNNYKMNGTQVSLRSSASTLTLVCHD
jgi:hypothetical protein